jgi:signal transduction histidine kinase
MRLDRPSIRASIRWTVLLLVLVPLLATIVIYSYAVAGQSGTAVQLANAGKVSGATIRPVSAALTALTAERDAAVRYVLFPSEQAKSDLREREAAADHAISVVRGVSKSGPVTANASAHVRQAAENFLGDLVALNLTRHQVVTHSAEAIGVIKQYSVIMNDGLSVAVQAIQENYTDQSLAATARADVRLYQAALLASEEGAFYAADVADGNMTPGDQISFAKLASLRQYLVADAVPQLNAEATGLVRIYVPDDLTAALVSEEDAITSAPAITAATAVPLSSWQQVSGGYASNLLVALTKSEDRIQSQLISSTRRALAILIAAASVGLLTVIVSLAISLLIGRRLVRRLGGLRAAALDLAHYRLPNVMARLRAGETVDVDAETPQVAPSADEIGQVQQAFTVVLRAAVQAGADEADLRRGLNYVFRNMARRSQALLHRQLALLDAMERRADEPGQLEDLFRIDHLTTRMRRHAEGLIILAGESPGRRWSQPVPFIDVLRAATAEVEDYTRIQVAVRTDAALVGHAVADVVHLLAELIENATIFSPPTTQVLVRGELVGRGFAIEVEDRGLGIPDERLARINRDLAENRALDLTESDRLGLFITGRLAHRHGINVSVRSSSRSGSTATVIIPTRLVVPDDGRAEPITVAGRAEPVALGSSGMHASIGSSYSDGAGQPHHPAPRHSYSAASTDEPGRWTASDWWSKPDLATWLAPASAEPGYAGRPPAGRLPVRVPQASLPPQLRKPGGNESATRNLDTLQASAEAARSSMSALQRGWERGRTAITGQQDSTDTDWK